MQSERALARGSVLVLVQQRACARPWPVPLSDVRRPAPDADVAHGAPAPAPLAWQVRWHLPLQGRRGSVCLDTA
jgi:hypothetical protein